MSISKSAPFSRQGITVFLASSVGLVWSQFSGDFAPMLAPDGVMGIPYGRSILASISDIVVLGGLICLAALIGLPKLLRMSGLLEPILKPLLVFGAIFGSAAVVCLFLTPVTSETGAAQIAWLGVGGPVTEEIVFRGLAIGALMRLAGWRFFPAILAPALVFGLAHAVQGSQLADSAAIIAITALGGLFFGWLFVRWGFNLWPAILAHIGLNTMWIVFVFGETAIGDWFGNGVRLSLVILIVLATLYFAPARTRR